MKETIIREPTLDDKNAFLAAMQRSQSLHHPWVKPPLTVKLYAAYFKALT